MVEGEAALVQLHRDTPAFTGLQINLDEFLQFLHWTRHAGGNVPHINLRDLLAHAFAGVGDAEAYLKGIRVQHGVPVQMQIGIAELRVGQAMTEGVTHRKLLLFIIAVAHKDTLAVDGFLPLRIRQRAGGVTAEQGIALCQFAARICFTQKQSDNGLCNRLSAGVHAQNGLHILRPGHLHRRAGKEHHRHGLVQLDEGFNQVVLVIRQTHVLAVEPLGFHPVRQTGENHDVIGIQSHRGGFCFEEGIYHVLLQTIAGRISIIKLRIILIQHLQHAAMLRGDHMAAATALIAHEPGKCTDYRDLLPLADGQGLGVVLQQDGAFLCGLTRQQVMGLHIIGCVLALVCDAFLNQLQNAQHRFVQLLHRELAGFHSLDEALRHDFAAVGHTKVEAFTDALGLIVHRTPVGYNDTFIAPFAAKNLVDQVMMLRAELTVNLIIGGHDRPGLGFPHRRLKAGQINLPQGTFVHNLIDGHAAGFLVVYGKMLERGAHAHGLHTQNVVLGHLGREEGILGKILEIAAAQGAALDICARTQQDGHLLSQTFLAQRLTDFLQQLSVPAAGQRRGRGEAGSGNALVDAQMIRLAGLFAQTMGAVRHHDLRNTLARDFFRQPEGCALAEAGLFLQRQGLQNLTCPFHVVSSSFISSTAMPSPPSSSRTFPCRPP